MEEEKLVEGRKEKGMGEHGPPRGTHLVTSAIRRPSSSTTAPPLAPACTAADVCSMMGASPSHSTGFPSGQFPTGSVPLCLPTAVVVQLLACRAASALLPTLGAVNPGYTTGAGPGYTTFATTPDHTEGGISGTQEREHSTKGHKKSTQ